MALPMALDLWMRAVLGEVSQCFLLHLDLGCVC